MLVRDSESVWFGATRAWSIMWKEVGYKDEGVMNGVYQSKECETLWKGCLIWFVLEISLIIFKIYDMIIWHMYIGSANCSPANWQILS